MLALKRGAIPSFHRRINASWRILSGCAALLTAIAAARAQEAPAEPPATQSVMPQTSPVEAETALEKEPSDPFEAWLHSRRMTADWGGTRTALEDAGIKINLYYNQTYGVNARGGLNTTNGQRLSGSVDLHVFLDFEKMGLIPGGELFVWPKGHYSRNINPKVGALSDPIDDADGDKPIYIDVLQYEQRLFENKLRIRFGYLDQQMAFDRNAYANSEDTQFMTTYLDNDNAIVPLPIGLGADIFIDPFDWLGFIIGASDGDARIFRTGLDTTFHDGADFYGFFETNFRLKFKTRKGVLPGTYRFGLIYDPGTKQVFRDDVDGRVPPKFETGDVAFYMSLDQMVLREGPDDEQGLGLFFRYGYRDGDVNRVEHFWSIGAQYQGLVPGRDEDVLGFGVYSVHGSEEYRQWVNSDFLRETGYELYYKIQLTPWLAITPDLQYINRPGGLETARDSFVMALRARVIF